MLNLRIAKINQLNALNIYLTDSNEFAKEKNKYYVENIRKQKRIYKNDVNNDQHYKQDKINIKFKERKLIDWIKYIVYN